MNSTKLDYYKESGLANPIHITLFLFCSLITILILSYFYSLISHYIPIMYLNVLLTIGYGFSISFVSRIFVIIFKIRNHSLSIILTIVLALFAWYFQWVSYLFIISFERFDINLFFRNLKLFFMILSRPDLVFSDIADISKVGLWSLGTSSINIRGFILWLIWITEASIIIFIAYNNFRQFNIIPFSEKDNKWFKKGYLDFDFEHIAFKKKFVEGFKNEPLKSINELKKGDGLRYSKIHIYSSKTESKSLITINNIIVTQRGKGKKDVTNVLKLCYIDNIILSQIKNKFKIKKASILDQ